MKFNVTLNKVLAISWIAVALFMLWLFFWPFLCCGTVTSDYILSTNKYNRMIERAIEGNSSAIFLLGAHYASSQNLAMADFYNYSFADKEYALSDKHYAIIYKYAQEGNATAKNMIEEQEEIMKRKKKLLSHKDFIKECQMDDFCVRSDIYREYSSKQINETK